MGHSGNGTGGPSLTSWLTSGYSGGQFGPGGGHSDTGHSPGTFTSSSPTPFDDRSQASHSLLPFPPDMNFGDPSLGGLGSNKMGTFVSNNVGIPPTSIVTSSSSSHHGPESPDLFSSRLQQQQGSMGAGGHMGGGQPQVPSYTPSGLMGYSPLGSMGHAPPGPQVAPGHISPDFGGPGQASGVSGVVTKQETTFVDCQPPPSASGPASGASQSLDPGTRSAVSPATLAEFNQSTSKGHEILSQVQNTLHITQSCHEGYTFHTGSSFGIPSLINSERAWRFGDF